MQRTFVSSLLGLALLGVAGLAHAEVTVTAPWVRGTVAGQQATGAFMQLQSSDNARLVGVRSSLTRNAEVHEMAMENEVMRMRHIEHVELPAGQAVQLKPGGYHIMLMGLDKPLPEGATVDLTLIVENATGQKEEIPVQAPVRALNAKAGGGHGQHGGHGH